MGGAFLDLVARLQPQPKYMKLFGAIVRDVWKRREGSARQDRGRLARRVEDARGNLDRIAGLLADGVMDATTYEGQRDRPTQNLTVAELDLAQATTEHLEVDAILAFAENVLTDAARLWEHAAPEHRRKLQRAFFPEGLVYEPGPPAGFRTAPTCLAFRELPLSRVAESALVALRGFEPRSDG